jgi:hypothetical protein
MVTFPARSVRPVAQQRWLETPPQARVVDSQVRVRGTLAEQRHYCRPTRSRQRGGELVASETRLPATQSCTGKAVRPRQGHNCSSFFRPDTNLLDPVRRRHYHFQVGTAARTCACPPHGPARLECKHLLPAVSAGKEAAAS